MATTGELDKRWEVAAFLVAIAMLLARVVPGIWEYSLWLDEGYTRAAIDNLKFSLEETPGTMPAYYLFMAAWGQVSTAPFWLRLPSLLAAIMTLRVVQKLGRRTGGQVVGIIAALALSVGPMFTAKAAEARPYSLLTLLVAWTAYALLEFHEERPRGKWPHVPWIVLVAAVLGPFIHALFIVSFMALLGAIAVSRGGVADLRRLMAPIIGCVLATTIVVQLASEQRIGWLNRYPLIEGLTQAFFSGWPFYALLLVVATTLGGIVGVKRFLDKKALRDILVIAYTLISVILVVVIRQVQGVYDARYLAPLAPFLAVLVATGVVAVVRLGVHRRSTRPRTVPSIAIVLIVPFFVAGVFAPRPSDERLEDWKAAVAWIAADAGPADVLVFAYKPAGNQQFRVPFESAWLRLNAAPAVDVVNPPRPFGSVRRYEAVLDTGEILQRTSKADVIWVVSYRGSWYAGLTDDLERNGRFAVVAENHYQGDIRVELLEPRR